jgi:hypothetical protein
MDSSDTGCESRYRLLQALVWIEKTCSDPPLLISVYNIYSQNWDGARQICQRSFRDPVTKCLNLFSRTNKCVTKNAVQTISFGETADVF